MSYLLSVAAINANSLSDFDLPKFMIFQLQTETCAWAIRVRKRINKMKRVCFLTGIDICFGEDIKKVKSHTTN
jgi:hypothetical protein